MDLLSQIIEQIFNNRKINHEYRFQFNRFLELDEKLRKQLDKDHLCHYQQSCKEHDEVQNIEITQAIKFSVCICRNIFLQQPTCFYDRYLDFDF